MTTLDKQLEKILESVFFSSLRIDKAKVALKLLIKEVGLKAIGNDFDFTVETNPYKLLNETLINHDNRIKTEMLYKQRSKLKELLK